MKPSLFYILALFATASSAQDLSFMVGTNHVHLVFQDDSASSESKNLFLSDFNKAIAASENGLSIEVSVHAWHPSFVHSSGPMTNTWLFGIAEPKFFNGNTGFPSSLSQSNGVWNLCVSKSYTDAYASLCAFESAHSNEIAKLRAFVSTDLDVSRLASLSDDDIYEMYLSKQWAPGDRNGPSGLAAQDRPQILRGTYYQPPVAAVLFWPMGRA